MTGVGPGLGRGIALEGRRVMVIGASAGIGRSFAIQAVGAGAEVVLVARRAEALEKAVAVAGGGQFLTTDLRDADQCTALGEKVKGLVGELDLVFISAGAAHLRWVHEASAEDWATSFDTNVIGVNLAISSVLPVLRPGAIVAACSSESVGDPHAGLVPYGASKAALEESLRGWRLEHPEVRFSCVTMGATVPTEFGAAFEPERLTKALELWTKHGLARAEMLNTDEVAGFLLAAYATATAYPGIGVEQLTVRPSAGVVDDNDAFVKGASENHLLGEASGVSEHHDG